MENDDAVSPVIGVILMVAITVILAAVIAMFVFGMAGGVEGSKNVALNAKLNASGTGIEVIIIGGSDLRTLTELNFSVNGTSVDVEHANGPFAVGQIFPVSNTTGRLVVVGAFTDGAQQVILDRTFYSTDA